jgi:hypothetical protein
VPPSDLSLLFHSPSINLCSFTFDRSIMSKPAADKKKLTVAAQETEDITIA